MAPGDLQEVLSVLRRPVLSEETARNLMVGLGAADDAAVYRISDDLALVETVDFFPPVVDDAWTWGAVAAANAMSDVYAMGGEVMFALAIAGFPREMDKAIVTEVFRGGAEKVAEAGGVIAGFGFLGHAGEMVSASGAGIAVDTARLPFLPHARALAEAGHFSGGMKRNRRYLEGLFGARLEIGADIPAVIVSLLMEAETSGGLLFSVRPDRAAGVREAFHAAGEEVAEIGEVLTAPVLRLR